MTKTYKPRAASLVPGGYLPGVLFELAGERDAEHIEESRRAQYDVDCTPLPAIEQSLRGVLAGWGRVEIDEQQDGYIPELRVLDVGAGYGAWSMVLRRLATELGFAVHITGLEVREECRPHLNRNCDRTIIENAASFIPHCGQRYDMVMGNIPFSLPDPRAKRAKKEAGGWTVGKSRLKAFEVFVKDGRQLLADPESRLALFVPTEWTGRSGPLAELAKAHVPMFELYQALPVGFRLNAGTDTRTYKTAVWGHQSLPPPEWTKKRTLPILDVEHRTVRGHLPGTEAS